MISKDSLYFTKICKEKNEVRFPDDFDEFTCRELQYYLDVIYTKKTLNPYDDDIYEVGNFHRFTAVAMYFCNSNSMYFKMDIKAHSSFVYTSNDFVQHGLCLMLFHHFEMKDEYSSQVKQLVVTLMVRKNVTADELKHIDAVHFTSELLWNAVSSRHSKIVTGLTYTNNNMKADRDTLKRKYTELKTKYKELYEKDKGEDWASDSSYEDPGN